ncbi:hypothetical protein C8R45DRAFT_1104356 [Mycena sanguinolenta]|nr:hypothetical protein C8R45DRAFT_1104356 [Mycena sanguinolenta]
MDTKNIFDNSDVAMVSLKLKKNGGRLLPDYPQELEFNLLPSPYLMIAKTLEFSLPVQSSLAEEEAYTTREVYDDCDIPLDVVSDYLRSGGSSVASNFTVSNDGGIARSKVQKCRMCRMMKGSWMLHPLLLGEASARKSPRGVIWAPFGKSTSFFRVFSAEFLSNFSCSKIDFTPF